MKHLATRYETAITIMGVICGLAITRLATILTMNSRFYMIITSLEEVLIISLKDSISFWYRLEGRFSSTAWFWFQFSLHLL